MEYKSVKSTVMGIEDRTVIGVFCVHGNLDSGDGWTSRGDRSHPGLFGDFTVDGRKRAVFLWQHRSMDPPIATIDQLFEVARTDLPPAVLKYAPDATGGVAVKRSYLDTPRGNEVLAGLKAGAITEMSYAYDPTRWDFEKEEDGEGYRLPIRNLYQAELYDISDVNWGMNPATSADGAKGMPLQHEHDTVLAAVRGYTQRLKALIALRAKDGRQLSTANRQRIEECLQMMGECQTMASDCVQMCQECSTMLQDILDSNDSGKQTADVRRLYLEYQRALAHLNGVATP